MSNYYEQSNSCLTYIYIMKIKGYVFNKTLSRIIGFIDTKGTFISMPKITNKKRASKQITKAEQIVKILPIAPPEPIVNTETKNNFWENRFTTKNIFNNDLKVIIKQHTDITPAVLELAKRNNLLHQLINNSKEKSR